MYEEPLWRKKVSTLTITKQRNLRAFLRREEGATYNTFLERQRVMEGLEVTCLYNSLTSASR